MTQRCHCSQNQWNLPIFERNKDCWKIPTEFPAKVSNWPQNMLGVISFRKVHCLIGLFLFLLTLSVQASAQGGKWYRFEEEWVLDKYVTRYAAESLMLAQARKTVVENAMGVQVSSLENVSRYELLDKNAQTQNKWIEEYLTQTIQESYGKITEEKSPVFKVNVREGVTYLSLKYEAKVTEEKGNVEPSLKGTFDVNRSILTEGDTLNFYIECSKNAWVYLYNVNPQGDFSLIYPNIFDRNNLLPANSKIKLPIKDNRYAFLAEISNQMSGVTGEKVAQTEILFALFYSGNEPLFSFSETAKTDYSFVEFNKMLIQIPKNMRMSKFLSYTVHP